MKLRNLLMTVIFLLAVGASFASKSKGTGILAFKLTQVGCVPGTTLESNCLPQANGTSCTIWDGATNYVQAYYYGPEYIPCVAPLRYL